MDAQIRRAFAAHAIARELVARVAHSLARTGIPLMPLKGVWLQARVYDPPESRLITDVDVLVPEALFGDSLAALRASGFVPEQANASEAAMIHPDLPIQLDVHRRLFLPGAFALPTHALFARASRDSDHFDAPVWMPDPIDGLCHLVGHFVKSRALPTGSPYHEDFHRLFDTFALQPAQVARRLSDAGMARAARYAFAHNVRHGHAGLAQVVGALPADPLGRALCTLSMRIAATHRAHAWKGALPGYLLDRSLPAGVWGGVRRAADRALDA